MALKMHEFGKVSIWFIYIKLFFMRHQNRKKIMKYGPNQKDDFLILVFEDVG